MDNSLQNTLQDAIDKYLSRDLLFALHNREFLFDYVDSNYVLEQRTTDKVVVEYEVTNRNEIQQHSDEDAKREQTKAQTKEQLQQFITPPKGD